MWTAPPICRTIATLPDGQRVDAWTLAGSGGRRLTVLNLGGVVTECLVPDRYGRLGNVVRAFSAPVDVVRHHGFGGLVGRYANRIAGAAFALDGQRVQLVANEGPNTLHGGPHGFSTAIWDVRPASGPDGMGVCLSYTSPDGQGGFPGNLQVSVVYRWDAQGAWCLDWSAQTDRPTVINATHHAYFNLSGNEPESTTSAQVKTLGRHRLAVQGARVLYVDAEKLPQTEADVTGTLFDLRSPCALEPLLREQAHPQLSQAGGLDHCWLLNGPAGPDGLVRAATLSDPVSGRTMTCWTTEPALQVYTANFQTDALQRSDGTLLLRHDAICLETQHPPDAPNQPTFPSTVLRPGTVWRSATRYDFQAV